MPLLFEAIFTLNETLDNDPDSSPTYVISGDMSYYIDPISDTLKNRMEVKSRFTGLNISEPDPTTSATTTTAATAATAPAPAAGAGAGAGAAAPGQ